MQEKARVPAIRFARFTDAWEQRKFGETLYSLQNNTLSRAELSLENGAAKNVHYGDILVKFGEVLDVEKELLPMITDESVVAKYRSSFLENGDIVIADTAEDETVGKCSEIAGLRGEKVIAGLHTIPCRPLFNFASGYLGYYLNSDAYHRQLLPLMQGIKVTSISKSALQDTEIQYPKSLDEQEQIGTFFRHLDHLITLHQREYSRLCNVKKSMLEKMFPKDGASVPEIRFAGFTDAWEQRKLGEFSEIKTGPFGSTLHADDYVDDGVPIITTEHFKSGNLQNEKDGLPQVSIIDYKRLMAYTLEEGDLVFSRVGSVDINALITAFHSGWLFSGRVLRVRPSKKVNCEFLHTLLETEQVKRDIRGRAVGQTMPSINTEILKITRLILPSSKTEQEQIGTFFRHLDHLITLHQRELERLQNIKKSCLEKMFI